MELEVMTEEDLKWIQEISMKPNPTKEEHRKLDELYEKKRLPDDTSEAFAELYDESTDEDII